MQDHSQLVGNPAELEAMLGCWSTPASISSMPERGAFRWPFAYSSLTLTGWTKKWSGKPCMAVGGVGLQKDLQGTFQNGSEAADHLPDVRSRIAGDILCNPDRVLRVERGEALQRFNLQAFAALE